VPLQPKSVKEGRGGGVVESLGSVLSSAPGQESDSRKDVVEGGGGGVQGGGGFRTFAAFVAFPRHVHNGLVILLRHVEAVEIPCL